LKLLSFFELLEFLKDSRDKRVLLTFHSVGDRDGVASAMALSAVIENSVIATPDFITKNAKQMLQMADCNQRLSSKFPKSIDLVIVTDANRYESLGSFCEKVRMFDGDVLFVDHHIMPKELPVEKKRFLFNDERYNSTSSIAYELLKRQGVKVGKMTALMLLSGIIADSADFQNASPDTFREIAELLDMARTDYSEILEHFHSSIPVESRYEMIGDILSSSAERAGKYVFVHGKVEGRANSAADAAIRMGADASLFWTFRKNEVSVSARLRSPLDRKLGMHLGALMQDLGAKINGNGGGHPCAAGAYGPGKDIAPEGISGAMKVMRDKLSGADNAGE
jgi:nanoRNase/pAp phosphatase (c-di-AMP/oligoRNAs hydrolase)